MIDISIYELEPYINSIRQLNQLLTDTLFQMKNSMLMVENYWQGITSETFIDKVHQLDQKINYSQELVEKYVSHLETIIEQYRLTETNLNQNIAAF